MDSRIDQGRPYNFKFFQGCLPQILRGLYLNTLTQILLVEKKKKKKL